MEKLGKEKNKKDINEVNKQQRKNEFISKDAEIQELKKQYELSKQRENLLKEKIKALEDKNNAANELNTNLMATINELYSPYQKNEDANKKK